MSTSLYESSTLMSNLNLYYSRREGAGAVQGFCKLFQRRPFNFLPAGYTRIGREERALDYHAWMAGSQKIGIALCIVGG